MVKTPPSNAGGAGSILGGGTKIPQASGCSQKVKKKKRKKEKKCSWGQLQCPEAGQRRMDLGLRDNKVTTGSGRKTWESGRGFRRV